MSTATYLRTRVDRKPLIPGLLLGDALALLAFAAMGVAHHGGDPLGDPGRLAWTAAPFLLAWLAVAFLGGLYTTDAVRSPRRAASLTVPAWVLAALIGQGIRATSVFPGNTALSFFLVTVVVGGALVVGWRVVVAVLRSWE